MRYAIACEGEQVAAHFGRCEYYELVDIRDGEVAERERLLSPGHGEPGELPRLMQQRQVDCVICGGAGPRAQNLFEEIGMDFVLGASGSLEEVIAALAAGELGSGEDGCFHNE